MGWSLRIPGHWRPLRVVGGWSRGTLVAGDAERVLLQVKWIRPGAAAFEAERWMEKRLRREARGLVVAAQAPRPSGFAAARWARPPEGASGSRGAVWYGWAPGAGLLVEVVVPGGLPEATRRFVVDEVLPSLRAAGRDEPALTTVLGRTFEAPAGFRLVQWTLRLGDVLLRFEAPDGERLALRQVYPAPLALSRRPLERWLATTLFAGPHRRHVAGPAQSCELPGAGRGLHGVQQHGWKRLPFPLGRVAARESLAIAVHDEAGDRLLIAEHEARGSCPPGIAQAAVLAMARWEAALPAGAPEAPARAMPGAAAPQPRRWWQGRTAVPRLSRDQSLESCPERMPVERTEPGQDGGLRLCFRVTPRGGYGWLVWGRRGAARTFTRTVELDGLGREVYEACDGTATVRAIVERFGKAHRLGSAEAELAVTRFMQLLVGRGVVAMRVRTPAGEAA